MVRSEHRVPGVSVELVCEGDVVEFLSGINSPHGLP